MKCAVNSSNTDSRRGMLAVFCCSTAAASSTLTHVGHKPHVYIHSCIHSSLLGDRIGVASGFQPLRFHYLEIHG
jgi:hypothetical protein